MMPASPTSRRAAGIPPARESLTPSPGPYLLKLHTHLDGGVWLWDGPGEDQHALRRLGNRLPGEGEKECLDRVAAEYGVTVRCWLLDGYSPAGDEDEDFWQSPQAGLNPAVVLVADWASDALGSWASAHREGEED